MNIGFLKFWKNWDEDEKASAIKIVGLLVAAFTIFTLIATLSYLFHWKEDMGADIAVANMAGSFGHKFGQFLIRDLFGLGSFAFLVILAAASIRLLTGKCRHSLFKITIESLTGAFLCSMVLSFTGHIIGYDKVFGGGMGGWCGDYCTSWSELRLGIPFTAIVIAVLILCWILFSFGNVFGKIKFPKAKTEETGETEEEEEEEEPEETVPPFEEPFIPIEPEPFDISEAAPEEIEDSEVINEGITVVERPELQTKVKEKLPRIDNRLDPPDGLPDFKFFPLNILNSYSESIKEVSTEELNINNRKIRSALADYGIQVADVQALVGPTVTLYKVVPAAGVKISEIKRVQDDIAMKMNAGGVRVISLPDSVGIEVANNSASIVPLRALLNDSAFRESKAALPVAIGYTITRKVKVFDLTDAPHLLIAGATQQGKSVGLNVIISSLLYAKHPSELKFVFIDPKRVEFSSYAGLLKHYLAVLPENDDEDERRNAIVKNAAKAEMTLRSLCIEMDERYKLLEKAGVNKLSLYNDKYMDRHLLPTDGHRFLPYLVVVVDEYSDLIMSVGASSEEKASSRSISTSIIRLAQKGRAAGIHVILATQRPSVDVISGLIKSNFPMRIAFRVSSRTDSQTILDSPGAEKLIGRGDMLFSAGIENERIQCAYISGDEINSITAFIEKQQGYGKCYNTPYYLPSPDEGKTDSGNGSVDMSKVDERFEEAAKVIVLLQKGSTSALQTKLGMGFSKAARVMDQLESAGIVGASPGGGKPREVLVSTLEELEEILAAYR